MVHDQITILQSLGPVLAKTFTAGGVRPYDRAKTFTATQAPVSSVRDLSAVLTDIESDPTKCVIRGAHRAWLDADGRVTLDAHRSVRTERNLIAFAEVPRRWVCLDVDGYCPEATEPLDQINEFIELHLPDEFQSVTLHYQLSNSYGTPGAAGKLKAHLWFWLDRAVGQDDLDHWARTCAPAVDVVTFRTVQVHYTAAPVIESGAAPELRGAARSGLIEGMLGDEVALVLPERAPAEPGRAAAGTRDMTDPAAKGGLVGAFCRVFPVRDTLAQHLAHVFVPEGDSDTRLTWLHGSGAVGGAVITDDEAHVYNSHATDPLLGRAANAFDLCRAHLFGHLDDDVPVAERLTAAPHDLPSHAACVAWVRSLPEMQESLAALRPSASDTYPDDDDDEGDGGDGDDGDGDGAVTDARERAVAGACSLMDGSPHASALEQAVRSKVAGLDWSPSERERLARAAQARFQALTGNTLPVALARQWLTPPVAARGGGGSTAPDWLGEWVMLQPRTFFHIPTKRQYDATSFDAINQHRMPLRQGSTDLRQSATDWAVNAWGIKMADGVVYAPGRPELWLRDGVLWCNTFDDAVVRAMPDETTDAGRAAVRLFLDHMTRLLPDELERGLIISWMAHVVRNPGAKVRWAPYIHGEEGAGKTFIATLMAWMLGRTNVRTIDGTAVASSFNGWADGRLVSVIEEARQAGHFVDLIDALKAPISNDEISIHKKGREPYDAPNGTNYLILSNHPDAYKIEAGDRRLLILHAKIGTEEAAALSESGYYKALFDTCEAEAGQIKRWLALEWQMHPQFDHQGRAVMTKAKTEVIEMLKPEAQRYIEDIAGGHDYVSSTLLMQWMRDLWFEAPKGRVFARMMRSAGFTYVAQVRWINSARHEVWCRKGLEVREVTPDHIRESLKWMRNKENDY